MIHCAFVSLIFFQVTSGLNQIGWSEKEKQSILYLIEDYQTRMKDLVVIDRKRESLLAMCAKFVLMATIPRGTLKNTFIFQGIDGHIKEQKNFHQTNKNTERSMESFLTVIVILDI